MRREIRITVQGDENIYTYPMSSRLKVRIPVKNPRLWSPENPELYDLRIEAGEDVVESYFAMRSFGVGSDEKGKARLLLNGKPCQSLLQIIIPGGRSHGMRSYDQSRADRLIRGNHHT